jgi:hypothetical protein
VFYFFWAAAMYTFYFVHVFVLFTLNIITAQYPPSPGAGMFLQFLSLPPADMCVRSSHVHMYTFKR